MIINKFGIRIRGKSIDILYQEKFSDKLNRLLFDLNQHDDTKFSIDFITIRKHCDIPSKPRQQSPWNNVPLLGQYCSILHPILGSYCYRKCCNQRQPV